MSEKISYFVTRATLFLLLFAIATADAAELPIRGYFNGYLEQLNVLECENGGSNPLDLLVTLVNNNGSLRPAVSFHIPAFGANHLILTNIADSYGTILLNAQSSTDALSCRTAFYRYEPPNAAKALQFGYVIPFRTPQVGASGGLFNSYSPGGGPVPTANWLSIVNTSASPFSALVHVYDYNGLPLYPISVESLGAGERRDYGLGHPEGERVGAYIIQPASALQAYDAFLVRYGSNGSRYNFAVPLQSAGARCEGLNVQISTMGNGLTENWIELANLGAASETVALSLFNRFGVKLHEEPYTLAPFSQRHFYVNAVLDPAGVGDVGYAVVECSDASVPVLVQSAFYGKTAGSAGIEWAYAVPARRAAASVSDQLTVPVNSYLNMANWLKLAAAGPALSVSPTFLSSGGASVVIPSRPLAQNGTDDVPIHDYAGYGVIGSAVVTTDSLDSQFSAEIIRVLPRNDNQIGYIMHVPSTLEARAALPEPSSGYFPANSVWYQDISAAPLDSQSSAVINWLQSAGGWGNGNRMQIDFSIQVLEASADVSLRSFTPTGDFYSPDCDLEPMPVPSVGTLEGETGYQCLSDGDCHLIVASRSRGKLYEMWRGNIVGNTFYGGCLAVWDMNRTYPGSGRGENCTSADAAGYPIAPLLFTPEEVASGAINHAIRFILPNSRIRHGVYLHPATHSTGAASGGANSPPYGTRLRLRADYPLQNLPNEAARVVARAMQRYGMFLADGGSIALTAASDRYSAVKWDGLLGPHDLFALKVQDFQMVEGGTRIPYTGDCVRQ